MCAPPAGGIALTGIDLAKEAPVVGRVTRGGVPVGGAYVRLLDASGEFTAEVVASATGEFRFFAAPGSWTLRALAPGGAAEVSVTAATGTVASAEVALDG